MAATVPALTVQGPAKVLGFFRELGTWCQRRSWDGHSTAGLWSAGGCYFLVHGALVERIGA
jgi:hypothetical protein